MYDAVSPAVVMRSGVAFTGTGSVSTAMSLSMAAALYAGLFHCRQTPETVPPCRSPSADGSWVAPVTTAPLRYQLYPLTQCAAVRIFVGATTVPPQKKPSPVYGS